jgi:hypothetical protein
MARVSVQFLDDEVLVGEAQPDLNRPDFWLEIEDDALNNNHRALVPLVAVKSILLEEDDNPPVDAGSLRKVAVRFQDGEVVRGHLNGQVETGAYGIRMRLYNQEGDRAELLGIPYSALKAIFYLKDWDGRPPEERDQPSAAYLSDRLRAPLVGVLAEIEMLTRLHESGLLDDGEFERKRGVLLDRI